MIKEAKLLKVEVAFNMEEKSIEVEAMCTDLFKSMIETTDTELKLLTTMTKIENAIEDLMSTINDKMGEKKEEK